MTEGASREAISGLDSLERRVSFVIGGIGLALAPTARKDGLILAVILAGALAILFFSWRKNRVGIIVAAFMMGLMLQKYSISMPYLILGGWLGIRAFRLQKYGDPTFVGSNQQARLRAQERAANRKKGIGYSRGKKSDSDPSAAPVRPKPAPSKRYTPKQTGRRR